MNKLRAFCKSIALVEGVGYRLKRTQHGTSLDIESSRGGGASVRQFLLVSIQNDFYTCYEWDGTAAGTEEIYIARPFNHRVSNFHLRTIEYNSDGDSYSATYSYSSATKRTVTIGGVAETQVLIPHFKTGFDIIYATESEQSITAGPLNATVTDPNDAPISLLDLNLDGRSWAKI